MTEKTKRHGSQLDPDKLDLSSLSADELVRAITGIEAPTIKQKFEALEVLAEKAPKGDATLKLTTDIICELKTLNDYPNHSKEVAEGNEAAEEDAYYFPLELYVSNPDAFGPEGLKMMIKIAKGFYRLEEIFSGLESQISAAKSNPF